MTLNKYQRMLQRKLYHCRLIIETLETGRWYSSTLNRQQIHALAQKMPDARVLGGNLNTHLLIHLPFVNLSKLTLKYLDEHMDTWLQQDCLMPELYLIGGYYPQKDNRLVFNIMQHDSKIYIYGRPPVTDMPVYHITDTKLIRHQCGEIMAPATKTIEPWIDKCIRDVLNTEPLYFI